MERDDYGFWVGVALGCADFGVPQDFFKLPWLERAVENCAGSYHGARKSERRQSVTGIEMTNAMTAIAYGSFVHHMPYLSVLPCAHT